MIKSGRHVLWMVALPITLVLATTGCASKKYVRNQVAPVDARVNQLQAQTKEQISYLNNKEPVSYTHLTLPTILRV